MADPVTDSRFPGFNPEVEESKAAEAEKAKAAAAAARGEPGDGAPVPKFTHRCAMCGGLFEQHARSCPSCGANYELEALPSAETK